MRTSRITYVPGTFPAAALVAVVLLGLFGCLAPPPNREGESLQIDALARLISEGAAAPVQGTVDDGGSDMEPGEPYALADPKAVAERVEPDVGEAQEDEVRDSPYLRFGPRIMVHEVDGVTVITKPYPLPVGKARKMVDLMRVLQPFLFQELPAPGAETPPPVEPPNPNVAEFTVLENWDTEAYSFDRNDPEKYPPPQPVPVNVSDLLVATAGYELLEEVEDFINVFAAGVRQIEIEAKIIEVVDSDSLDIGIKPIDPDTPLFDFPDGTFVDSFSFNFPNSVDPTEALLTLGAVQDGLAFNAILEALETFENVSIDQRPKVAVREGVPAVITTTQDIPFFTISSINPAGNFTSNLTFKPVGVSLYVAPRVVGTDTLALDVHIESSQQVGNQVTFVLEDGSSLPTPLIASRTAKTVVYLQPGQALIIGGLTSERSSKKVSQVPILGSLPILGALFRSKTDTVEKAYVLFAISPRIIQGSEFYTEF